MPLVKGKLASRNKTTAYVCVNQVCSYPTSDPVRFAEQIAVATPLFPPPEAKP